MTEFVKALEVQTHSEAETLKWAEDFAKTLPKGSVLAPVSYNHLTLPTNYYV